MPKTIRNVFDKNLTYEKLIQAHYRAVEGKRHKEEILRFEMDLETNIANIMYSLETGTYHISKYREFTIYEPKERVIKSLPYKDRVVHQWYVHEFIKPYFVKRLISDTFACIDERGTHTCALKTQKYMRKMLRTWGRDYYIIKADVRKYFYSINKEILFKIVTKRMGDKKLIALTRSLIFDGTGDIGIPIGNYTSQYFANIYLNELDQYVKNDLRIKYYLRYMDDFCIMLPTKEECRVVLEKIRVFLRENLELELNSKTRYYPSKFGVNFCGYIIYENRMLLRKRCILKIKRGLREKSLCLKNYNGHLKYADCHNLLVSLKREGLLVDDKDLLWYNLI